MRRRIYWLVVGTTASVLIAFVVPLCLLVRTVAEDRAMAEADQLLGNVAALIAGDVDRDQLDEVLEGLNEDSVIQVSVLTAGGRVIGSDRLDPADPEVVTARAGRSVRAVDERGGRLVVPVVDGSRTTVVRAWVPTDHLREGVARIWLSIVLLGFALLGCASIAARSMGRRVSEPLLDVARVAARLSEGDLASRAVVAGPPETAALAHALNDLADRTTDLLAAERASVADLSHRLRTPVTALRLDAEAVADPVVSARIGNHIGVLQRSIDAIVHEARRPVRHDLRETSDVAAVVAERVEFWRVLADDQGRRMTISLPPSPVVVALPVDDVVDLVDVLIDNVFAHTPDGTAFSVSLTTRRDVAHLRVSDAGPGMASRPGRRQGSTGLGLDIARRTARAVGGDLIVEPTVAGLHPGAVVQVTLGLAGAASRP